MRWAALLLGLLPLGCTQTVHTAAAPRPVLASCAVVGTEVRTFTEVMESASIEAKTRVKTYAGLLAYLVSLDDAASTLDRDLTKVTANGELGKKLGAAHGALERSVALARAERALVEKHVHDVAPLAKETQQAWGALRAACERRGPADCNGIRSIVARYDAAETKADHEKAVAELGGLKLSPGTGRLRDRAGVASQKIQVAMKGHAEEAASLPKKLVAIQKDLADAMGGLTTTCRTDPSASDLVVTTKPDPRRLTVLVHMKPPAELVTAMLGLAKEATDPEERSFYEARAEGAFGSGFFLVKRDGGTWVVTNRHVVELGDRAELSLADGTSLGAAEVVYANPTHDLAILRPLGKLDVNEGFALAATPAKDQQTVVATGFPGIIGKPSYQTTKGYVSNESFLLDDGTRPLMYVQHTAPIDPGSSGGPLTDESGKVLGVNTLKITGREAVGLAVPSRHVASTLDAAIALPARHASAPDRARDARLACLGFLGELGATDPRPLVLEQMIANRLVGAEGLEDAGALAKEDGFEDLWTEDSLRAMRIATLIRIRASFQQGGGPSVLELCDDADLSKSDVVTYKIRLGNFETRKLALRWEQGRWKIDGFEASRSAPSGKAKKLPSLSTPPPVPAGKRVNPPKK